MADTPGFAVPPLACDCHMHVFGAPDRYPPAPLRSYTPTEASLDRYRAMATALGLQRVVLVQPSAYGTDNTCMLDALRAQPDVTRGVAVIDAATPEAALDDMHRLGVRGIRLNLVSNGVPDGTAAAAALREAAGRVAPHGWHVQVFALPDLWPALLPLIPALPVPVVVDHMGAVDAGHGEQPPGLAALLDLLAAGRCWVKLSGANRASRQAAGFRDALAVMRTLVAANPERLVWGTDWPHIGPTDVSAPQTVVYMPHDNADLLRLLGEAVPDAATRRRILVDNPAWLYGF